MYLDWTVRWFPRLLRRDVLDDLRHGWRLRRLLVTGAWLFGLGAVAGAWTEPTLAPVRATGVVVAAVLAVCANGILLVIDEPEVLRLLLPRDPRRRALARSAVMAMWAAPAVALGVAASWAGLGPRAALWVLCAGLVAWAAGATLSWWLGPLRQRGLGVYGASATLVAAALVWVSR